MQEGNDSDAPPSSNHGKAHLAMRYFRADPTGDRTVHRSLQYPQIFLTTDVDERQQKEPKSSNH